MGPGELDSLLLACVMLFGLAGFASNGLDGAILGAALGLVIGLVAKRIL